MYSGKIPKAPEKRASASGTPGWSGRILSVQDEEKGLKE
jgi:hypothetical protein